MATVEMSFTPLPAHVRTARLVATAVARRTGVAETLLDEVRLAVGEACSRAVEAHQAHCPGEPVRVALTGDNGRFEVVVTDTASPDGGAGARAAPAPEPQPSAPDVPPFLPRELGLAVIAGLVDDVRIARSDTGLSIHMSWPSGQPVG